MTVGTEPLWATCDYSNGWVYVPNYASGTVSVINGTQVVGTVRVGSQPYSATYDSGNGFVYVLNQGSSNVSVLNGTHLFGTVKVGNYPYYAAYDPQNGYIYVPNEGASSVSVINGTKVVATVTVGSSPDNATYDPANGYVYVPNRSSDTVSVLNGTKVIATVAVGISPWSGTYDSKNGYVYVPNDSSGTVSVINNTTLKATVRVGSEPLFGGYDSRNGFVYQANYGSANVSVIDGTKVVGKVAVGNYPFAAAFDPGSGDVYIPNSYYTGSVSVINGTSLALTVGGGSYSQNAVFDSWNGAIYVPNEGSNNVSVIVGDNPVTFTETGLPTGTPWQVNLPPGVSNSSSTANISFTLSDGSYNYTISTTNLSYANRGGSFTMTGRALIIHVRFQLVTYPVTFTETGLPNGTVWSLVLGGLLLGSSSSFPSTISHPEPNGSYSYSLARVPGWSTFVFNGTVLVSGMAHVVPVAWFQVTYPVEFQETGLHGGTLWWINLSANQSTSSTNPTQSVNEPNGSYSYTAATTDKTYAAVGKAFVVNGSVIARTVAFNRVTFPITFTETGLPSGTNWSVALGGASVPSSTNTIRVPEANGTYIYSFGKVAGWTTAAFTGTAQVLGSGVDASLNWTQVTYLVTFTESGLPKGTHWTVTFDGVTNSSSGTIGFSGIPNGTGAYQVRTVTGFVADHASGAVDVKGSPASQPIAFSAVAVTTAPPPAPTVLGLPATEGYALGGVFVAVLAVAGVVGVLLRRRRESRWAGPEVPPDEPSASGPFPPS
ncbi:MAG: YncE family protein [Thermoplasmata archaeon]|nr:YncE family protein [Thermoplasmata archaeon]